MKLPHLTGRPLWWVAGLVLALLTGVGVGLLGNSDQRVEVTTPTAPAARSQAAANATTALAAAITGRTTQPANDFVGQLVQNAVATGVGAVTMRYVDERLDATPTAADHWVGAVEVAWRFPGFDRAAARTEVAFEFAGDAERAVVVGPGHVDSPEIRAPLWLTGAVEVRRTPGILVIARHDADRYLRLAKTATAQVREVLPRWRRGLVVEVGESAEDLARQLAATDGEYDQIAAVTTTPDGGTDPATPVHIYLNPAVFDPLTPVGAQVVMTHETTHVATGAALVRGSMPLWLVEGFADHVALRDVTLPVTVTAAQATAAVRADGVPEALPSNTQFDTTRDGLGAAYEMAWLACEVLADLGGEAELVDFYRSVTEGASVSRALAQHFALSNSQFTQLWQKRLRDLLP